MSPNPIQVSLANRLHCDVHKSNLAPTQQGYLAYSLVIGSYNGHTRGLYMQYPHTTVPSIHKGMHLNMYWEADYIPKIAYHSATYPRGMTFEYDLGGRLHPKITKLKVKDSLATRL